MHRPRLQVTSITIGAPDPRELGRFYAQLLGTELTAEEPPRPDEPPEAGWAQLRTTGDRGTLTLSFEWERVYEPPVWPSVAGRPQTMEHLDIYVDDLREATDWAVSCGATLHEFQPQADVRVLLDPAGHPFCLFT
jgi:catechol 2,3-dioxygenase-like lactoylglutathione lyase family enzyme